MLRLQQSLIALLLLLIANLIVFAANVPSHNGQRVVDTVPVLNLKDRRDIDRMLADFEVESTNQILVLIIPTLAGETIESYANKAFRTYQLGQKDKNNGVLLVIARNDRKLRIEVGYGLEEMLTDSIAGQIIREKITPQFKNGKYADGIKAGLREIMRVTYIKPQSSKKVAVLPSTNPVVTPVPTPSSTNEQSIGSFFFILACIFLAGGLIIFFVIKILINSMGNHFSYKYTVVHSNDDSSHTHNTYHSSSAFNDHHSSGYNINHNDTNLASNALFNSSASVDSSAGANESWSSSYSSNSTDTSSYSSNNDSISYSSDSSSISTFSSDASSSFSGGGGDSGGGGASSDW